MFTKITTASALSTMAIIAVAILVPEVALAQGSDEWVKPATDLIDTLRSGVVLIGTGLVGIAVMGYGIYTIWGDNPNFKRLGMIVLGGAMIVAGPYVMAGLLEIAQQS